MKVIKRDGRLQNFDLDKIKLSIARISEEDERPMNSSDIDNISKTINNYILNKYPETINSYEIKDIIVNEMRNYGFDHLANYYENNFI